MIPTIDPDTVNDVAMLLDADDATIDCILADMHAALPDGPAEELCETTD